MVLAYSFDDERYTKVSEKIKTIKEAIDEAIEELNLEEDLAIDERGEIYANVNIGEIVEYDDSVCVETFIGNQQDRAYDEAGEYAEWYLDDIKEEAKAKLEQQLNDLWENFKKENEIESNFFKVENIKNFKVKFECEANRFYKIKSYEEI